MSRRSRSRSKSLSPEGREIIKIMEEAKKKIGRVNAEERKKKRLEAKKLEKGKSITPPDQRVKKSKLTDEQKKAREEKRRKRREKKRKKKEKKETNSQGEKPRSKRRTKRLGLEKGALKVGSIKFPDDTGYGIKKKKKSAKRKRIKSLGKKSKRRRGKRSVKGKRSRRR